MLFTDYKAAYLAESGNFSLSLDDPAAAVYFLACALIVDQRQEASLIKIIQEIREEEFEGGELRIKPGRGDHGQRFRILKKLLAQPFDLVYLVLDKRKTYFDLYIDSAFTFKEHLSRIFYRNLKRSYHSLKIIVNGGKSEFQACLHKRAAQEGLLFNSYEFREKSGRNCNLLQLADFFSKTLALGYGELVPKNYKAYLNFLQDKIVWGQVFPRKDEDYLTAEVIALKNCDHKIAAWAVRLALDYISKYGDSNLFLELDRVAVLERFLFQLQIKPTEYLGTDQLKGLLYNMFGRKYSNHQFRADIIAPLRDAGVIISSSSKGYKIPLNLEEVHAYSKHTLQVVYPMLERLRKCRNSILTATDGKLDIIEGSGYEHLRSYFQIAGQKRGSEPGE
ncbi:MAG: DUF3800 domain-containing protein [Firmicutes bacterium]|nr:DUF3800 domain-containing protein [Bacillota bacterium]